MKKHSLVVVICATLLALTVALGWLPFVFLLPTLFAAACFDYKISFVASFGFGIISLLMFLFFPASLFMPTLKWYVMNNMWLPIVARMFIGPITHAFFLLASKLTKKLNKVGEISAISLSAAVGSALNTLFMGGLIFLIGTKDLPANLDTITVGFLAFYGLIEIAVTAIVLPPLVLATKKAMPKLFAKIPAQKATNTTTINNETKN